MFAMIMPQLCHNDANIMAIYGTSIKKKRLSWPRLEAGETGSVGLWMQAWPDDGTLPAMLSATNGRMDNY